ncbi:MAG TPA: glycerophosphodiester phosphodiesterase [Solirubrobacteraceae bacterium]
MAAKLLDGSLSVFGDTPVLCGHRGSGRGHEENTLPSFRAAVDAGLRWVEVDARATADGVLVARHDPELDDGRTVADLRAAEAGLMRVADLFEELPDEVSIDVEVKTALEDALRPRERTTAALVAELVAPQRRRVLVTSFDPAALLIVRERLPRVPLGLLTWTRFPLRKAIPAARHLGVEVVAANVESFPPDAAPPVRVAHEAGLEVAAWCPAPEEREALLAAGVDCLVIDDVTASSAGAAPVPPRSA